MKIIYLNGADIEGGAARAATRLLKGVRAKGLDARLIVQRKSGNDPLVEGAVSLTERVLSRIRPTLEQLLCGLTPGKLRGPFCSALLPDVLPHRLAAMAPDIIHLHWVARMMRLETLERFQAPIIWTLHDSWPFTGGCYLPGDCNRYRDSCGVCPMLDSHRERDLSRRIWERKRRAWDSLNLIVIAPSTWMAAAARSSSLFRDRRIEVIPNGIDVTLYKPCDKPAARKRFNLPQDKKLILFGAKDATSDRNKGFHLLQAALGELAAMEKGNRPELVLFGAEKPGVATEPGVKIHYLGWQGDDTSLAQLYSAADLFVLPSLQENLPYTVMEAMACGTPCVAFDQGGVSDLVDHHENGYLARPYDPVDVANGISWIFAHQEMKVLLDGNSRRKIVAKFSLSKITENHTKLYRELILKQQQVTFPSAL